MKVSIEQMAERTGMTVEQLVDEIAQINLDAVHVWHRPPIVVCDDATLEVDDVFAGLVLSHLREADE
jgi:hypothetical protein